MQYYLVDQSDLEAWTLYAYVGNSGKGIIYQADTSYSAPELISCVEKRFQSHIENMVKKEFLWSEDVIQDEYKPGEDDIFSSSHLDDAVFSKWSEATDYGNVY